MGKLKTLKRLPEKEPNHNITFSEIQIRCAEINTTILSGRLLNIHPVLSGKTGHVDLILQKPMGSEVIAGNVSYIVATQILLAMKLFGIAII